MSRIPGGPLERIRVCLTVLATCLLAGGGASIGVREAAAGAFQSDDAGVRAAAMGGAFTSVGGEPAALYWNPATLFFQTDRTIEASYSDLYGLGLAKRTYLTFGNKALIEEPHYSQDQVIVDKNRRSGPAYALGLESLFLELDENGYSEMSLGGGYSWGYDDRFAVGLSLRALFASSDFDQVSGLGYNLGIGVAWQYSSRERLGLGIPNLLSRMSWDFESTERIPVDIAVGWSRTFAQTILISGDVEWRENEGGIHRAAAGAEWWIFPDRLALRGGFRHLSGGVEDIDKPSFGASVRWSRLRFDYAFRMEPEALGDTHRLGLLVGF